MPWTLLTLYMYLLHKIKIPLARKRKNRSRRPGCHLWFLGPRETSVEPQNLYRTRTWGEQCDWREGTRGLQHMHSGAQLAHPLSVYLGCFQEAEGDGKVAEVTPSYHWRLVRPCGGLTCLFSLFSRLFAATRSNVICVDSRSPRETLFSCCK